MSESPLQQWIAAVQRGNAAEVRRLLADHPELADHVKDNVFPFDSSAVFQCRTNLELVDLLIAYGADLNQKTGWWAGGFGILEGVTADVAGPLINRGAIVDIWAAVGLNDTKLATHLLDEEPDLIRARGGDGKQPLHYAQDVEMVDLLISYGADVHARDVDHESTPAQHLVDNEPVVRRLIEHGAEPDAYMAAALGDVDMAERCVEMDPECTSARLGSGTWATAAGGHCYNWTLGHDATPLDVAFDREHTQVLEFLLRHSTTPTLLRHAVWHGDEDEVARLTARDPACVDQLKKADGSMIALAAWSYRPASIRLLLDLGFDRHAVGVHRSTPLDRASFHGYADIVEMLLDGDANPPVDYVNEFGGTPLAACVYGVVHGWKTGHPQDHVATARLLIKAGSDMTWEWLPTGSDELDAVLGENLGRRT